MGYSHARVAGVYCIKHIASSRCYVGSSVNIFLRWIRHRDDLRTQTHHSTYLQRVWTKYGPDAFEFKILEETLPELVRTAERTWIETLQPVFNSVVSIGEGVIGHSEATRAKMTLGQKRFWEERRATGRMTHTDAHKAAISAGLIGRKMSDESRAKMSASAKKRPPRKISPEECKAISLRQKGRVFSEETRKKMSEARKAFFLKNGR